MNYCVLADERHYTIREPDGEEWGCSGEYGVSVTLRSIHRSNPSDARLGWETSREFIESDDIPAGATAFVVLCQWTDGDTFGSNGYWCVATVKATQEAASAAVDDLNARTDYSVPWTGYFAGLDSIEVVALMMQP